MNNLFGYPQNVTSLRLQTPRLLSQSGFCTKSVQNPGSTYLLSTFLRKGKTSLGDMANAALAGGVAIGATCNIVAPATAFGIGVLGGALCVVGYFFISVGSRFWVPYCFASRVTDLLCRYVITEPCSSIHRRVCLPNCPPCSQFERHRHTYVSGAVLAYWGIVEYSVPQLILR